MPAKSNKCCCNPLCPTFCVDHGDIHTDCGIETALFYNGGSSGGQMFGTGDECCPVCILVQLAHVPQTCTWIEAVGDCDWLFEIDPDGGGSGMPTATITLTTPGGTIVWANVVDPYNPLCCALFEYDADLSEPPNDCSWCRFICLCPDNSCCDTQGERSEQLPNTLFATISHCCFESPVEVEVELTWDPTKSRWVSEGFEWCDGTATIEVFCVCGTSEGCGQGSDRCYEMRLEVVGGCDEQFVSNQPWDGCNCEPFELEFSSGQSPANCCSASTIFDTQILITE